MRWSTYERWVSKYDAPEEMLNGQLVAAAARLMKRIKTMIFSHRDYLFGQAPESFQIASVSEARSRTKRN
jgi:hypothetical protein